MSASLIHSEFREPEPPRRRRLRATLPTCAVVVVLTAAVLLVATAAQARSASLTSAKGCTPDQGQLYIDSGQYKDAIREFTCVIAAQPTEVEGYRGRIEAELLLGKFSDAAADHARVTAKVLPVHPDTRSTILAGYSARLKADPDNVPALTGASFANWWFFDYPSALHLLDRLVDARPNDLYGILFRGSNHMLHGTQTAAGAADLEHAIAIAPTSPDVRFIVADAYTYGQPNPQRAFDEASLALSWGLDTPRIHAILATSYLAWGDQAAAAAEFKTHIDQVTTELVPTSSLAAGGSLSLDLVAGRTFEIPVAVAAGESVSVVTSSRDFYDSILVLLAPDGTPVLASDDYVKYFAGFTWVAPATGTYKLRVTSFEGVSAGALTVTRD